MRTKDELILLENRNNRRIVNIVVGVTLVLSIFLILRYAINSIYINQLNNGKYNSKLENSLLIINAPAGYVPHYNKGNAAYLNEDYDTAIKEYQSALSSFSPHPEECSIRINLALSIIQKIDFDHLDNEISVNNAIELLLSARSILTEEDCANEKDTTGHSEEAEQLKKDIDEMLKKLMQNGSPESNADNSGNSSDGSEENESQNGMSQHEQEIQQQLQQQMQDALSQQNQAQSDYDTYTNGGFDSPQEFSGKKW